MKELITYDLFVIPQGIKGYINVRKFSIKNKGVFSALGNKQNGTLGENS